MPELRLPKAHAGRRESLRALLRDADLDALLVTDLLNIRYLTGFTGSNAALLVQAESEDKTIFCTDGRYLTQSAGEVPDLQRVFGRASALVLLDQANAQPKSYKRIGFESQFVSVEEHHVWRDLAQGWQFVRAPGLIEQLRQVKDQSELTALRRACAIVDGAIAELVAGERIRAGRSEVELAHELDRLMQERGSEKPSFDTIIATGVNSAIPHHQPNDTVLANGDFFTMDFGAVVDGYHSDITRTVVLGPPAQWQRELYDVVHQAQAVGLSAARAGAEVLDVYAAARDVINAAGYGERFLHGLGHGVGLRIHEAPMITMTGVGRLSAGMAVTIEPGIYLEGRGGVRIEDTLVVSDGIPEVLTLSSKELITV